MMAADGNAASQAAPNPARSTLAGLVVFLLCLVLGGWVVHYSEQTRQSHERALAAGYAKDQAQHIRVQLERGQSAAYALAALVHVGRGSVPDFNAVATQMLPLYPGVSELALAPDGIIQQIVPLTGNESALGTDLLTDQQQRGEAVISRDSGQLTLNGPLQLIQGGLALVGRLPVSMEQNGSQRFWGFTEVVMRLPDVLQEVQLRQLVDRGYHYQLWRIRPDNGQRQIIDASTDTALPAPVEQTLVVPNGHWTLSLAPIAGWADPFGMALKGLLALLVSALSGWLIRDLFAIRDHRLRLTALVAQRTAEIDSSRRQLSATLDAIPDLVWLKNPDGVYLSCNPQFERLFGASEAEIVGRTDYDFVPKDLADFFRANDQKAIELGKPTHNEEWLTFKTGDYHGLFETVKTPMRNTDGTLIGVLGIARDITERKRVEKALRNSKAWLSVTLEATNIGIWDWDLKNDRWSASPAYFRMLGYKPVAGPIDRQLWMDLVHPDDRDRILQKLDAVLSGKPAPYEYEARIRHSDGDYRWVSVRGRVVQRDTTGRPTRMLGVRMDTTERRSAEERIRRLAYFDTLTDLPNRALLKDRISFAIGMAQRRGEPLTLLVLDLDKFKNINDTLGHHVGDELLTQVAHRIKALAREEDTIARLGGDEFILVAPGFGPDHAVQVAKELVTSVSASYVVGKQELTITPSIGIAVYPTDGEDYDTLFKCADTALHRAKADGRNTFRFFTAEMHARAARHLQIENALRRVLERNELQLHFQPQFSLKGQRVTGVEALLRWQHPELGAISPAEFIPLAEESGQILPIGAWVLRNAVLQAQAWCKAGMEPLTVAVNISSVQFRDPNLPELVSQVLAESGLPPDCLELELTESVAMHDPQSAIAVMEQLRERAVRLSIDDFGTGYSSLNYLKRFPIYKLKIDRSFVSDLTANPDDRAIVSGIINLANSLGLHTLAEGVETQGQLDFLQMHGCNEAQGYLFSKPLPADALLEFLRGRNPT